MPGIIVSDTSSLIIAKEKNIINSVSAIIDDIQKTDFRLSQKLIEETKRRSGE